MTSSEPPRPRRDDAADRADALVGRRIADRYAVGSLIARGGMARVYRARDDRLQRDVALKVLAQPFAADPEHVERFLGEARTAASLSHPNLVHVYDSGTDAGLHYIVMELLERYRSLRAVVAERGPLPPAQVIEIGRELLAGLRLVHDRGLVHCDVKSANVMLGPGPTKLIDFGIARTPAADLSSETSIGSLHYMAPEQLHGERLSPASDLYGVGVVLYEALTGHVPFDGRTPTEVAEAQRANPPIPPAERAAGIPEQLSRAVLQALAVDPARRFTSASAMLSALDSVEAAPPTEAVQRPTGNDDETTSFHRPPAALRHEPAGWAPPPGRRSRRRARRGAGIGAWLVTAVSLAAIVFVVWLVFAVGSNGFRIGGDASPSTQASARPGLVIVPNTIGMTFQEGIDAATAAGLDWTVACSTQPDRPEQIFDQEPPAGTQVAPGSPFTMFFPRFEGFCGGG